MARVTVIPETFHLVDYDGPTIAALAETIAGQAGIPTDAEIRIEVDETTPFGRTTVRSIDPIVLGIESGGLENPKKPKGYSEATSATSLSLALWRIADRLRPEFAAAPPDDDLSFGQRAAWDAYSGGRAARAGWPISRSRLEYHFRNRHGFTDTADAVFVRLWDADSLTWPELEAAASEASAAKAS